MMYHHIVYSSIFAFLCVSVLSKSIDGDKPQDDPFNLTPLLENGKIEQARKLSVVDSTLFAGVKSYSGYFNVNKTQKWNLFFWYFPAVGVPLNSTPLVVWLQGGPGGSSLYGLFTEIGPIKVVNGTAEKMPISWNSNYSLLFIDNPVGTGFSYSEGENYATDEDMVGASLLSFIQQFLDVFSELRQAPLFIAGESYAGKYIPAFGHYIHSFKNSLKPINLRGVAIGDGWTDPPTLLHYSEWALQVGLLDQEQADQIHKLEEDAREYWKQEQYYNFENAAMEVWDLLETYAPGLSSYNYIDDSPFKDDFVSFLNKPEVQRALHVNNVTFEIISDVVYSYLYGDRYKTVKPWLEELVENYGVMCYSGQLDMIVAYALSVHTYRSLQWSGAQQYLKAPRRPIYDSEGGLTVNSFVKSYGNFWDVMVRGAGHSVPTDKPRAAKQIIDLFIKQFK